MWEGRKIDPRGKDDMGVRDQKDGMHLPYSGLQWSFTHISDGSSLVNGSSYVRIFVN